MDLLWIANPFRVIKAIGSRDCLEKAFLKNGHILIVWADGDANDRSKLPEARKENAGRTYSKDVVVRHTSTYL